VGRLLVPNDRGLAAFVRTLGHSRPGSFRSQLSIVTARIEPSFGPAGENRLGFLRCYTCANGLASLCRSLSGIAVAFAAQITAAQIYSATYSTAFTPTGATLSKTLP
jgi:hypothetical protein